MILDHAAEIVAKDGVSKVTMELLGRSLGVSKSLMYAYFPSVTELLTALLEREYRSLRRMQAREAERAETLEQLVRRVTSVYLSYIEERGLILERLAAEPSLAGQGGPTEYGRETAVANLATILANTLDMDESIAVPLVDISFGIPSTAGNYLIRHNVSRQTIEDITVAMILGSIESVQKRYKTSLQPIRRTGRSAGKSKSPNQSPKKSPKKSSATP
jgi:AcrR family transcriptional regulator